MHRPANRERLNRLRQSGAFSGPAGVANGVVSACAQAVPLQGLG